METNQTLNNSEAKAVKNLIHGIDAFRASLRGTVIRESDEDYHIARKVWNGVIDKHPVFIVKCAGTADVMKTVEFARKHELPVSVRGGGHNVSGSAVCDHGVVIDLSLMRYVRVDPLRKTVRVDGGALLGDVDHETQAFGLAVPMGVVSKTGVAGLALHGGMGFLTRKFGLTSDNLIAADVVTAGGRLITADAENHPDLLWALRGGGGNFGVVTSFEFQAHDVGPEVWIAVIYYPVDSARKVLQFFRKFNQESPDELNGIALLWNAPMEEAIPEKYRGAPVIVLAACYCGEYDKGDSALEPLRNIDTPIAVHSGPMPYLEAQKLFDPEYPDGRRYYWKSTYINDLNENEIQALIDHAARRPSPITSLDIWALGGAFTRVGAEESAFAQRDAPYLVGIESNWDDPSEDEANIAWAQDVFRDLQRFSPGGAYLNFPGFAEEGEDLMKKSYGRNYARLQAIKAKYDPDNFFRSNFNIRPE